MSAFSKFRRKLTKTLYKAAGSKVGSVLTGRFIVERKIQKRDLQASGGKLIDLFGSPATAGTKQQTTARVGAVIYGGVVAAGAVAGGTTAAATGTSGAAATTAGGVTAGSAVAVPAATGWGSTLGSIAKYTGLGLALSRQFGIGPGAPQYSPDSIPSENIWGGLPGAIYPGYQEYGGPAISAADSGLTPDSGFFSGSSMPLYIGAAALLFLGIFIFMMRR